MLTTVAVLPLPAPPTTAYEDTCVSPLPVLDISRTLLGAVLGRADDAAFNARIIATTRRLVPVMYAVTTIYGVGSVVVFLHGDRAVRAIAAHACGVLGMLILLYALATLVADMVRLLLSTFEFWFLFAANACNIALWYTIVVDERRAGLFIMGACFGVTLLADANVYTRPFLLRTIALGAVVLAGVLALLTMRRLEGVTYPTFRLWDLEIEAVDLLLSGSFVIAFFFTARVYRSRHLILSIGASVQRVPCDMYFPLCQLVPQRGRHAVHAAGPKVDTSSSSSASPKFCRPLTLVQNDASRSVDIDDVFVPAIAHAASTWPRTPLLLNVAGAVGLTSATLSSALWLLEISATTPKTTRASATVDRVGAVATAVFTLTYAAHAQRTLAKRVALELDAWFVLLQISVLTVGACDAVRWTTARVVVPWSIWLWCVWVLFLDAVPPVTRRALGLSRRFVLLLTALLVAYPVLLGYWLYLSPARHSLQNREMVRIPLGPGPQEPVGGRDLRVDVLGFLASKLFTHFVWMGRFFWRELLRPRDAFKLLKRRVFYAGDRESRQP